MNRKKVFIIGAIVWMMIIFFMSNQTASVSLNMSGSVIDILNNIPIAGDLLKDILKSNSAQFIIRKAAHMFSYGMLAILCFIIVYELKRCSKKAMYIAFFITFVYACTDEIHQLFIPGRSGRATDVIIDCIGAFIGLIVVNSIVRVTRKNKAGV